ncbi:gamma-glutamyl-gamma-aminobutyrate hydrolase family protein [Prodigiosinella aquatilis]|nr:gamma-glutamyl-gamma-aminobutyrate hydrolase family protein [Prodigiosinella sp. LS101]WJV54876.1 gamma-glutamyl-gamma-aminobutyrate hydrolase family protein [Prodigiosinella sp. LS101]WJV59239.1 gamma-glutamyl-gamma-aminobutyrate hydrolase family protein [Pectobacteriaceae bacterium C111]
MKRVALTMRSDRIADRNECRDGLDNSWLLLLDHLNASPLLLPNVAKHAEFILASHKIDLIILTGGGDVSAISGDVTERDKVEKICMEHSLQAQIPVMGVCRGMQALVAFCGGELNKVCGHVASRHPVSWPQHAEVNSFHKYGVSSLPAPLTSFAASPDGLIEGFFCTERKWMGLMWHPEREVPFSQSDLSLIRTLLNGDTPCMD